MPTCNKNNKYQPQQPQQHKNVAPLSSLTYPSSAAEANKRRILPKSGVGNQITPNSSAQQILNVNNNLNAIPDANRIYRTQDGAVIVQTDQDVYVNTYENVVEQRFINFGGAGLTAGTVSGSSYSSVVGNVTKLGFDTSCGFGVTDLGDGLAKITVTGGGGPGTSGYSGLSGWSGAAGSPGGAGASGYSGVTGSPGGAGASGYSGETGGAGASGYSGAPGAGTPAGSDTEVQFNDGGVFGAEPGFTYNKTTNTVGLNNMYSDGTNLSIVVNTLSPPSWYNLYGDFIADTAEDYSSSVVYDSTGNVYTIGADGNTGIIFLLKFSANGDLLWQKTFTEINNYYKAGDSLVVDGSDNIICSISVSDAVYYTYLIKLDGTGAIIWQSKIENNDGITSLDCPITDLRCDSSNNVYAVVARRKIGVGADDVSLLKFNSGGVLQWQRDLNTLASLDSAYASGLAVDSVGNSFVCFRLYYNSPVSSKIYVCKYDTTGAIQWQNEYDITTSLFESAGQITVDSSGNLYFLSSPDNAIFNLIKTDGSGNLLWTKNIGTGLGGAPGGAALDSGGNFYAMGYGNGVAFNDDFYILKYDPSGTLLWQRSLSALGDESIYWFWVRRNLDVLGNNYVLSGYTYSPTLNNAEAIVSQLPTDGSNTGTYGIFTYAASFLPEVTPTVNVSASSLVDGAGTLTTALGDLTVTDLTRTATYQLIAPTWSLNGDGTTQLPGYTLTATDGTCGQALVTDGAGNVSFGTISGGVSLDAYCSLAIGNGLTTSTGKFNIAIGCNASVANGCGKSNFAVGYGALKCNTKGLDNVALGECSLRFNDTGGYNTAIGYATLTCNTTGRNNIAIGWYSMGCNVAGNSNIGLGNSTLYRNTTGSCNIAQGYETLYNNTTGYGNIGIGNRALYQNTAGCNNIGMGYYAGYAITTGVNNIAIGCQSLTGATVASHNIAIGKCAISFGSCGCCNTAIGYGALRMMNTGRENIAVGTFSQAQMCTGCGNISLGACALYFGGDNDSNIAVGSLALYCGSSLGYNIAIGDNALKCGTGCFYNIALGASALFGRTTGSSNIALGYASMFCGSSGNFNVAIGRGSMAIDSITGSCNTAVGSFALQRPGGGSCNIAVGSFALACNFNACLNIAIGQSAMQFNCAGYHNIAMGNCALFCNFVGCNNFAAGFLAMSNAVNCGCDNIAIGKEALRDNTGGTYNIAMGCLALGCNTVGDGNIAQGYRSLRGNTTGCYNLAIGMYTLDSNTYGNCNIAQGYYALNKNTTGSNNIALGTFALYCNRGGFENIAQGYKSLFNNSCGNNNIGIGYQTSYLNTTGSANIALGLNALYGNVTGINSVAIGVCALRGPSASRYNVGIGFKVMATGTGLTYGNVGIGSNTLYGNLGCRNVAVGAYGLCANTTGYGNTALGWGAGLCNITGQLNVAVGFSSGLGIRGGNCNISIGTYAGGGNGSDNIAIGNLAVSSGNCGAANIGIGAYSLTGNTSGTCNVALGKCSLRCNSSGAFNVSVGWGALGCVTYGSSNLALGHIAGCTLTTGTNNIFIGCNSQPQTVTSSNTITLGDANITCIRSQVTTISTLSDARDKTAVEELPLGLQFILDLRPVKFTWNMRTGDRVGIQDTGFLAQDVADLEDAAGATAWLDMVGRENPERLELKPAKLIPILVKAVQELNSKVDELEKKIR